jgi:NTE family protein
MVRVRAAVETMSSQKIAIACQGGGSQTAFTAGVLSVFFDRELQRDKQIVSLSGTSGGAVCAALAWYGLLKELNGEKESPSKRIKAFWEEIIAQLPPELVVDKWSAELLRLIEDGVIPHLELSPLSALSQMMMSTLLAFLPRKFFTDLKGVLEAHIHFEEIPNLVKPDSPVLLLGAADVLTGELKKFNSRKGEICVEAILASAAIPTLFPAVEINGHHYWDGLFSDNPPIKELIRGIHVGFENIPDEIWVIQINPITIEQVPKTNSQIYDRRNEMEGNVSLMQNLEFVEFYNMLLREKLLDTEALARYGFTRHDPIEVRFIRMSDELQSQLDYVSKLSREPSHIHRLIEDGEKQGAAFLESIQSVGVGL